ncbi:MAG TPA: SPFH domain-containing protein [Bryobacteraceae bacterium]|nr:SPFH domain-containing protein [Bryobacteraceae bacterium]
MSLRSFLEQQFIDVIQWTESDTGVLAYRFPMSNMEIQSGAQLTVRESQMAVFVNEGRIADVFKPGLYTLTTRTLPLLTDLKNWDKEFQSPFKSDVYFFSTRLQIDQKWGTPTPISIRDKEFGAVRVRAYGIYSYRIADPRVFFTNISATQDIYAVEELEGQLRNTIVAKLTEGIAPVEVPFLDMAANLGELTKHAATLIEPAFTALGLALVSFVIENLSLPEELQKFLDQRISMNMVGDVQRYTQFSAAQAIPAAAANPGGGAGMGVGLGAGIAMGQTLVNAVTSHPAAAPGPAAPPAAEAKFCMECGKQIPRSARFCPECGKPQPQA